MKNVYYLADAKQLRANRRARYAAKKERECQATAISQTEISEPHLMNYSIIVVDCNTLDIPFNHSRCSQAKSRALSS